MKARMHKVSPRQVSGFTIVELLIVVVVIAILAAITIVAYNGITDQSKASSAKSAATQIGKKIAAHHAEQGSYPASLASIGVSSTSSTTYNYKNYGNHFCIAAVTGNVSYQVIDNEAPVIGNCVGLSVSTYAGGASSNLVYSGEPVISGIVSSPIAYSWGGGTPVAGGPTDNFIAVITGFIKPPVTGTYTIRTLADDRDLFYVNGQLLLDGSLNGSTVPTEATIALEANKPVRFTSVVRENGGNSGITLSWSYPGQDTLVTIPASVFNTEP